MEGSDAFWLFLVVGFAAQLVDGALGMAYGVISATVLLAFGVPPANVSASVHASKVFTGAASAVSHFSHRNVDRGLFWRLAAAGAVGGVLGAYVLTSIEGDVIKPYVVIYLGLMGGFILFRAWKGIDPNPVPFRKPFPVGLIGGFLDALGGGGWGPTVTTTLVATGTPPRQAIGTSNSAEFVVAVAVSSAFLWALLTGHWENASDLMLHAWAVGGLIVGGLAAAPLAAWVTKILPARGLTWIVGALVIVLAAHQAGRLFGLF